MFQWVNKLNLASQNSIVYNKRAASCRATYSFFIFEKLQYKLSRFPLHFLQRCIWYIYENTKYKPITNQLLFHFMKHIFSTFFSAQLHQTLTLYSTIEITTNYSLFQMYYELSYKIAYLYRLNTVAFILKIATTIVNSYVTSVNENRKCMNLLFCSSSR